MCNEGVLSIFGAIYKNMANINLWVVLVIWILYECDMTFFNQALKNPRSKFQLVFAQIEWGMLWPFSFGMLNQGF